MATDRLLAAVAATSTVYMVSHGSLTEVSHRPAVLRTTASASSAASSAAAHQWKGANRLSAVMLHICPRPNSRMPFVNLAASSRMY